MKTVERKYWSSGRRQGSACWSQREYITRIRVTEEWFNEAGWLKAGHGCTHGNNICMPIEQGSPLSLAKNQSNKIRTVFIH